ncbi:hypothetical protein LCGC14_1135800 [marine sediment metagenome]|uniref:Uncharacterized protein n=1 Tax=marine sediment metagenome TaxID=412755 RepID=A0A0F9LZT7_9ZZZZ
MWDLYTKRVKVNPGDTILHEDGEEWEIPPNLQYILVQESTEIVRSGKVHSVQANSCKLRVYMERKRKRKRK